MSASLTLTFSVDHTREQAFAALANVRGWWWGQIDGSTYELGSEFIYRVEDMHFCRIRITELVPAQRVSWLVVDSYLSFTADKEEWTGPTVDFEILEEDGRTQVRFTQGGLVREHECYDICATAWSEYIDRSLRSLVATGAGRPNSFEGDEAIDAVSAG